MLNNHEKVVIDDPDLKELKEKIQEIKIYEKEKKGKQVFAIHLSERVFLRSGVKGKTTREGYNPGESALHNQDLLQLRRYEPWITVD